MDFVTLAFNMAPLLISSYNCKHFGGCHYDLKKTFIQKLLSKTDFVCIQEHWLYDSQFHVFNNFQQGGQVSYHGKSAMDPTTIRVGRPHGGCVILWRDNIDYKVMPINTISTRLTAVQVTTKDKKVLLLFNIYLPCDNGVYDENVNTVQDVFAEIVNIMNTIDHQFTMVAGDFNTDLSRQTPHVNELRQLCNAENFIVCAELDVSTVEFTFENSNHCKTHIDHLLVSDNLINVVENHYSFDSIDNSSDHLAVVTVFNIDCRHLEHKCITRKPRTAWYKACVKDINLYKIRLDQELGKVRIPVEAINCRDVTCEKHYKCIDDLYNAIIGAMEKAGEAIPHTSQFVDNVKQVTPGWSEFCEDKRRCALFWHHAWKHEGCPHGGFVTDMRRKTRLEYHRAVKYVRKNEKKLRSESLAKKMCSSNSRNYWREIKLMRC